MRLTGVFVKHIGTAHFQATGADGETGEHFFAAETKPANAPRRAAWFGFPRERHKKSPLSHRYFWPPKKYRRMNFSTGFIPALSLSPLVDFASV